MIKMTLLGSSLLLGMCYHEAMPENLPHIKLSIGQPEKEVENNLRENFGGDSPLIIQQQYEFELFVDGRSIRDVVGGKNLLTSISFSPWSGRLSSISVTYQTRPLNLDETINLSRDLEGKIAYLGFKLPSPGMKFPPGMNRLPPFSIIDFKGLPYKYQINNLKELKNAFLDNELLLSRVSVFSLVKDKTVVSFQITSIKNSLIKEYEATALKAPREGHYLVNLYIESIDQTDLGPLK